MSIAILQRPKARPTTGRDLPLARRTRGALALALALPEKEASALLTIVVPVLAVVLTIQHDPPRPPAGPPGARSASAGRPLDTF